MAGTTGEHGTPNGQGYRTGSGWTWVCDHCHLTTALGVPADLPFDVARWLAAVDAAHYCEHKT